MAVDTQSGQSVATALGRAFSNHNKPVCLKTADDRKSLQITADHLNMTADHLCLICLNTADERFQLGLGFGLGLGLGFS